MTTVRLGLDGRRALIIDGTSEIGRACVQRLHGEGMEVVFTGSDRERGEATAREIGGTFLECDLRDREACDRTVERGLEFAGGRLDVLVTQAATVLEGSIEATPEATFRELLEVDLTAVFRVTRACFQPMRARGRGSMIHVASDAGIRAAHEMAAHSVLSAGLIAVAELFAAEGAPLGVRSNAVCPGGMPPANAHAPEVASVVAWLACDESAHVSGATVRVDGASGAAMVQNTRS
jgi:NAD(P)-dependent dehydrogenase (short-subunit alcohol dehydrogenase family)